MNTQDLHIEKSHIAKLLAAANADAALLYIYLQSGNPMESAEAALRMSASRLSIAGAMLRQLGLWQEDKKTVIISGERPNYSERDVIRAMDTDTDFRSLYREVQSLMGRTLNTEEMKILLGFVRYLGMSGEVVSMLVCYCKERARQKGSLRNPSLRTIEKEAYAWAELGIDTMEEAAAYIQNQNMRRSRIGEIMRVMDIRGRNLTPSEEKYAKQWLEMGFEPDAIAIAYDRTCTNSGGRNWAYMNRIITRWHEAGLRTPDEIKHGDKKPAVPKGATGKLGQAELDAIQRMLKED